MLASGARNGLAWASKPSLEQWGRSDEGHTKRTREMIAVSRRARKLRWMASYWARRIPAVVSESKISICLFALATACIGAKYLVVNPNPVNVGTVLRLGCACGAVLVVVWVTARLDRCSDRARLAGYAASLLAAYGFAPFVAVGMWISQADCAASSGAVTGSNFDLLSRVIDASIAAALLAAITLWPRPAEQTEGHLGPRRWSVLVLTYCAYSVARFLTSVFQYSVALSPRCVNTTAAALSIANLAPIAFISGFQEELAFTGVALALLLGARLRVLLAAALLNVIVRGAEHLYYADHSTVLLWLTWVAIWSGGSLMFGFWLGQRALAHGMSTAAFAGVFAVAAAIAHSTLNFGPTVLAVMLLLVLAGLIANRNWFRSRFGWVLDGPDISPTPQ